MPGLLGAAWLVGSSLACWEQPSLLGVAYSSLNTSSCFRSFVLGASFMLWCISNLSPLPSLSNLPPSLLSLKIEICKKLIRMYQEIAQLWIMDNSSW